MNREITVIGAGPAGMMAAGTAASRGAGVTLLEKNAMSGRKLLLTGNGRCNLTHAGDVKNLVENVITNGKFLYNVFGCFSNADVINFFKELGVRTKTEADGKVFPVSDRASDVLDAMEKYMSRGGVKPVRSTAEKIIVEKRCVKGVSLSGGDFACCSRVIIACGGASYPNTGSSGDGYRMTKELGHTVVEPVPALVPIEIEGNMPSLLKGVSLDGIGVKAAGKKGETIYHGSGDLIFTHYGISGPAALSASSYLTHVGAEGCKITLDLFPGLSDTRVDALLLESLRMSPAKSAANALKELHLPSRLADVLVQAGGITAGKKSCEMSREERRHLAFLMKNFEMYVKSLRPIEEAMVTSGGVCVDEINPRTMESKIVKGLFFAGEVIDVDADTGGYNLQIAFSTGYVAGVNCV